MCRRSSIGTYHSKFVMPGRGHGVTVSEPGIQIEIDGPDARAPPSITSTLRSNWSVMP
jgi:hypothetical protein